MRLSKKLTVVFTCIFLVFLSWLSSVQASTARKIVLFNDGVTELERSQFVADWERFGVAKVMDLGFMNGMVLSVPDTVSSSDLAADPRTADIHEDGRVELQAVHASGDGGAGDGGAGDGGAGDGGATSFIIPTDAPPNGTRPWGTLSTYACPFTPLAIYDSFNTNLLNLIVKQTLFLSDLNKINVAVFDTGVDVKHRDLSRKIAGGFDFTCMKSGTPKDDNGHGTHVAGSLCGRDIGILPYNPVNLYAVKVLDANATGDVSSIVMALQWAISKKMDIVNMSFAYADDNPALRIAVQKASEAGIVIVAAAGNHSNWITEDGATGDGGAGDGGAGDGGAGDGGAGDGGAAGDGTVVNPYPIMYPAAYPEVIAVGAMDPFGQMAPFSNNGPEIDLIAPGTDVLSTNMGGGYGICSGTSMATPHVSAVAAVIIALAKSLGISLQPGDVANILKQSAVGGKLDLLGALVNLFSNYLW